jgi:asparagine synthase (glutamine-hydrolysing)
MCGICGIVSFGQSYPVDRATLESMNNTLVHRGPDDAGTFIDERFSAGLAMRRLSIIDLSTGHQPIGNEDGTVWIVFNGEIYNHLEVRGRLESRGHCFSTRTDTEAILHAYEEYGDDCVHHLNGMFAFAIWDTARQKLLLARDRLGVKPLYYWIGNSGLVFGSELKALMAHPDVPRAIDLAALDQFLTLEYIPAPQTIFQNICKLPPGHRLVVEDGRCRTDQYWDIRFEPIRADERECVEALTALLRDAVKIRLMADVPLGAFLSGGIDSSTIVACMSEAAGMPVRTFSIGFEDATYNELPYARLVSQAFGTQHHEEILDPDITELALRLVAHFDEPFGDFSIFPTFLVSEVARQSVTVALSGDGGDEVFAGYDAYLAQRFDRHLYSHLPSGLRRTVLPRLLAALPPHPAKKGIVNKTKRFVEGGALPDHLQHARWMMFMSQSEREKLYNQDLRHALNGVDAMGPIEQAFRRVAGADPLAQQQYVDIKTYVAEDILTKLDRASMAASLEARVPLLDYRLVEFALNLPPGMKLRGNQTKAILRRAMAGRLPQAVLNKPKEGFSIPLKHWLRTQLRPLMADLLSAETVSRRGYFSPTCVTRWVKEHVEGRVNHSHRLWALMVFELWHRQVYDAASVRLPGCTDLSGLVHGAEDETQRPVGTDRPLPN